MAEQSLWHRIKRARFAQILAVYLGASWLVLQVSELLVDALSLPGWVLPVAVILLLIGLLVVVSTAWIQSLPSTSARERSGEVPGDWQIAPRDAVADLLRGRLPHLTWGRTLAGGVVAMSLLFGGAGIYVGFVRTGGFTPAEASAAEAAEGIAVVPFEVRGAGLEIWREGMMDLLTNGLDGVGGFRTIDSRTVMARWRQQVGEAPATDLPTTLRVAASSGARFGLVGSVVGLGDDVRLVANIYDLETGAEVAQGRTEGPAGDVFRLADELVVESMRNLLRSQGRDVAGGIRAETLTTTSLPALRAFLEGEAHYRRGRFADAVASYERAVAADTTFAIALVRLAEAYGWLDSANAEQYFEYADRARAQTHRLPPRYRALQEGSNGLNDLTAAGVPLLKDAIRKYPDDPEAWFLLAETYLHIGEATYATTDEIWEALERAVELDPDFAPYLIHYAEFAVVQGEPSLAKEATARYEALTGDRSTLGYIDLAIPLLLGDSAEAALALDRWRDAPLDYFALYQGTFARRHERFDREAPLMSMRSDKDGVNRDLFTAMYDAATGRLEHGAHRVAGTTVSPAQRAQWWAYAWTIWDVAPPGEAAPGGAIPVDACDDPAFDPTCHVFVGVASTAWGRDDLHARAIERLREEAVRMRGEDERDADMIAAYADIVEGSGLWRSGDRRGGRALLERHVHHGHQAYTNWHGDRARIELAWLEAAEGRPTEAIRYFRAEALHGWDRPAAMYGLARMYSQLGQEHEARQWYGRFADLTRTGDDLPRIREARSALSR